MNREPITVLEGNARRRGRGRESVLVPLVDGAFKPQEGKGMSSWESAPTGPNAVLHGIGDIPPAIGHEQDVDLIVPGTPGRSGLVRLIVDRFAETTTCRAPLPVVPAGPTTRDSITASAES